jgi:hypothetical protein
MSGFKVKSFSSANAMAPSYFPGSGISSGNIFDGGIEILEA